jgi:hypothetical protein
MSNTVATQNSLTGAITLACTCTTKATDSWVIDLVYTTVEPLLFVEPLIWKKSTNNAGIYGVHNFTLNMTLDATACRSLSSSTKGIPMTVSLQSVTECELLMNYLTPHDADIIAKRNALPCTSYEHRQDSLPAIVKTVGTGNRTCNSHTINSVPNKIYICVRKLMSSMTVKDSDSFLAITRLSLNFNNKPSLLANYTPYDLYKMSKRNGSKQSIYEFLGQASVVNGIKRPTLGSVVVIDPALDLNLPYKLAPGVLQDLTVQITVDYANFTDDDLAECEVLTVYEYNGVFHTEDGRGKAEKSVFAPTHVTEACMKQFGESRQRIVDETTDHSLVNVPLLNLDKSDIRTGSGVKSGGSFTESAMARIH